MNVEVGLLPTLVPPPDLLNVGFHRCSIYLVKDISVIRGC